MKRFISIILVLALTLTLTPISVFAEDDPDFEFELRNGEYYVLRSYTGWDRASVTVPSTYNGLPVKGIGHSAFSAKSNVSEIILPDSIEFIEDYAFIGTYSLTSIDLPENLKKIGANAFSYSGLTEVTIPDSVTYVENSAFSYSSLETVTIGASLDVIDNDVFNSCANLKTINFGPKVYYISTGAFQFCSSLETVVIPDTVTIIDEAAFSDCPNLKNVTLGKNLESIGIFAFSSAAIESIVIPDSVTEVGYCAFAYCENLKDVTLSKNALDYADVFALSPIEYNVYNGANYLGSSDNPYFLLESIPEELKYEENPNFAMHPDTEIIGAYAFQDFDSLESIVLPENIRAIGNSAFSGCDNLESIALPDTLTVIDDYAFDFCTNLKSIEIPASVNKIGDVAFSNCYSLETLTVDEDNEFYKSVNNNIIEIETKTLFYGNNGLIPDDGSVTKIGFYAYNGSNAESIVIPETVTEISDCAFGYAGYLRSIVIPDSVKTIGVYAFESCVSLSSITIGKSVESIGNFAFDRCCSLESITVDPENKFYKSVDNCLIEIESKTLLTGGTDMKIPSDGSVTSIAIAAFNGRYDIESIVIPNGITAIGNDAFSGCSDLRDITIPASVETIGSAAFQFCSSLEKIYCEAEKQPEGWVDTWNEGYNGEVIWSYKSLIKLGDIDMDGVISTADYIFTKRQFMGTYKMSVPEFESADIDGDGVITTADYILIKRAFMGTYQIDNN